MQVFRRLNENLSLRAGYQAVARDDDERPILEKITEDHEIESRYQEYRKNFGEFENVVMKSAEKYSAAVAEARQRTQCITQALRNRASAFAQQAASNREDDSDATSAGQTASIREDDSEAASTGQAASYRENDYDAAVYLAYENAIISCTKALAVASNSKELADTYYRRACRLREIGLEIIALTDTNLAQFYLTKSRDENLQRRTKELKRVLLAFIEMNIRKIQDVLRSKPPNKMLPSNVPRIGHIPDIIYSWIEPYTPSNYKRNSSIPDASKNIAFVPYSFRAGSSLTAVNEILLGDCLMITKPYAMMLSEDSLYTHCSHCSFLCLHLIPCPDCSLVMFCCEPCRIEANKHYHEIECQYLKHLLGKTSREVLLTMRVVMRLSEQGNGKKLDALMKDNHYKRPFSPRVRWSLDEFVKSNNDETLARLPANFKKMDEVRQKTMLDTVARLLHLLKKTTTFFSEEHQDVEGQREDVRPLRNELEIEQQWGTDEREHARASLQRNVREIEPQEEIEMVPLNVQPPRNEQEIQQQQESEQVPPNVQPLRNEQEIQQQQDTGDEYSLTDREIFVGRLLLKFLCATQYCSHSIQGSKHFFFNNGDLRAGGTNDIGIGFYPLLHTKFLKQSCNPNVIPVYFKNYVQLYAVKNLEEGTRLSFGFGGCYWNVAQVTRQKELGCIYLEKCKCKACKNNWQTENAVPQDFPEYKKQRRFLRWRNQEINYEALRKTVVTYRLVGRKCLNSIQPIDESEMDSIREDSQLLRMFVKDPFRDKAECRVNTIRAAFRRANIDVNHLRLLLWNYICMYPLLPIQGSFNYVNVIPE